MQAHRNSCRNNKSQAVYNAWRKYGEPLARKIVHVRDEDLAAHEIEMIDLLGTLAPNGYNSTLGGDLSPMRVPELVARAAASNTGKKRSPEVCARQSEAMKGKNLWTPERRAKMSAANKGQISWNKGKGLGKGSGKPHSAETKAKMSAARKGRPHSLECRTKMSVAAHLRYARDPEERAKTSASIKASWERRRAAITGKAVLP